MPVRNITTSSIIVISLLLGSATARADTTGEISTVPTSPSVEVSSIEDTGINESQPDAINEPEITLALSIIENIPDDILLQGDEATILYLKKQIEIYSGSETPTGSASGASAWMCGVSILGAIVGNAFTVSKILKIRSAIRAAGSATKFAKLLISAYKQARAAGYSRATAIRWAGLEAAAGLGAEAQSAILSLLGISGVVNNCF